MASNKKIQISLELFDQLVKYHLFELDTPALEEAICDGLRQKLEAAYRRELFTRYRGSATPEEAEAARIEYLRAIGLPEDRW